MSDAILVLGAVAYDAKVVPLWDGFRAWFEAHGLPFDYVLYTLPRLFHATRTTTAISPGDSDRDALLQFHREWYGDDQMTRTVANGL